MKRRSVRLRDDRQKPERRQHGETARWCPHVVMAENLFNLCSHLLDLHFGLNSGLVGLKCCRSRLQLVTGLWLWTDRNESFIQLLWKKKTLNWNTPAEASGRKEKSVKESYFWLNPRSHQKTYSSCLKYLWEELWKYGRWNFTARSSSLINPPAGFKVLEMSPAAFLPFLGGIRWKFADLRVQTTEKKSYYW